jgi:hypothetical protein
MLTLLVATAPALADPDEPVLGAQADLDGTYVHLGPTVAAVRRGGDWDSVIGGALSVLRVREHEPLAVIGGRIAAARWTSGGGRVTAEGTVALGADVTGVVLGLSAGPMVDLADLHHPRIGASAAIWCYAGVVPYLRVGVIEASGGFVEAGIEIPLPVWRRR